MEKLRLTRLDRVAAAATIWCALSALVALGALAPTATARAPTATAKVPFQPRIKGAMGIVPALGAPEIAVGSNPPVVYHGGSVMRNVTIHTIFWAPSGYHFDGPPTSGVLGYEPLVQRFFTDIAHDSGTTTDIYSVLRQYGDGTGPGQYAISYNAAADSIDDTDPYPPAGQQCASPQGVATCVTDLELEEEIDHEIGSGGSTARGLNNLWFIFLPPNVDTCTSPGECGSNVYGGYHSWSDLGSGVMIYAVIPDPLIEGTIPTGLDPEGNPDAEEAIGAAAHETIEAMTNPLGDAWMDPNGMEVADKCEVGPEIGTPLGYASDGSPYNELINGDEWLIQMMWSNAAGGCVQSSTATNSALPLAEVHLTQFSPVVSGSIGATTAKVGVTVVLERAGVAVGKVSTRTRSGGDWGPVALKSLTRAPVEAFGDDRDTVFVRYQAGGPPDDTILTGDGGNPFTESGWTGWFDLDHGFSVESGAGGGGVLIGPCSQTGALELMIGHTASQAPTNLCETETDVAIVGTGPIAPGAALSFESEDNRAVTPENPNGALVSLSVPLGEPNSVPSVLNDQVPFFPTGFPTCTADLRAQRVTCTGLVPGARYMLTRRRGHAIVRTKAGGLGATTAVGFPGGHGLRGGDVVTLRDAAHRTLSTLHVAHLRVNILGAETVIASGTCEPGDYYGPPPTSPPTNAGIGAAGIGGTGTICPLSGSAKGLPVAHIEQTDDLSGGVTFTDVPQLEFTTPSNGETLYGPFTALAGAGIPTPKHAVISSGARVAVTITPATGGSAVFHAANVNTAGGVPVPALSPGTYRAKWVLTDASGDTRTVLTRFVEES
jgi:hypothetical protein